MRPVPFSQKELDREKACNACCKFGTPTPGVDHSTHWKPSPYADRTGSTLAELTAATNKAFGIAEKE